MIERELTFDISLYSSDAIQRAIYRLSDRLSCDLESRDGAIACTLYIVSDDAAAAEETLGEFRNEVLDQVLRQRIRQETELTRNVILSLAFSQTDLTSTE